MLTWFEYPSQLRARTSGGKNHTSRIMEVLFYRDSYLAVVPGNHHIILISETEG